MKPLPPAISLTLEIQHLRLLQPSTTQTPKFIDRSGRIFPDPLLNSNQRFSLEIYVSVPELESELESVELGDRPLTYRAQCYLRNLTDRSSASSPFAETPPKPLSSGRSHYAIVLPELQLSRGIHLLQVLVLLQDRNSAKPVAASSFELPWLQVL
ncbi:hypothetical protein [Baaleninema sp.]|uniref:hypothetical protein n=1 Tax=Baaleninema sp. TaxID=3101197 RepID=UPI003CFFAD51